LTRWVARPAVISASPSGPRDAALSLVLGLPIHELQCGGSIEVRTIDRLAGAAFLTNSGSNIVVQIDAPL